MSLKLRLLIYINGLLTIAILIGLAAVIALAQKNVREEILSTQALANFAIEMGIKKNPEFYLYKDDKPTLGLSNLYQLRHLKIELFNSSGTLIERSDSVSQSLNPPPRWFTGVLSQFSKQLESNKINLYKFGKDLGFILITPEPIYEYVEIWQQVKGGLWIIAIFFILVNLMVLILFSYTLSPINTILSAYEKLEGGNYNVKIKKTSFLEFDSIGQKFNSMVSRLKKNNEEIHRLSQNLINVQEQEKRELAINLHDELGQVLTAIQAQAASIKTAKIPVNAADSADTIIGLSKSMMLSTRTMIKKLSLGLLNELGLELALKELIENWVARYPKVRLNYDFNSEAINQLKSPHKAAHVYRIIQEALTNISKHSTPTKVEINLRHLNDHVTLSIKNNGSSARKNNTKGMGLIGMKERVSQMGGTMKISKGVNFHIYINLGKL
jgi:two-component system, NarL family, sensor histidine kinase UhpB